MIVGPSLFSRGDCSLNPPWRGQSGAAAGWVVDRQGILNQRQLRIDTRPHKLDQLADHEFMKVAQLDRASVDNVLQQDKAIQKNVHKILAAGLLKSL